MRFGWGKLNFWLTRVSWRWMGEIAFPFCHGRNILHEDDVVNKLAWSFWKRDKAAFNSEFRLIILFSSESAWLDLLTYKEKILVLEQVKENSNRQILDVLCPVNRERSYQGETKYIPTTSTNSNSLIYIPPWRIGEICGESWMSREGRN